MNNRIISHTEKISPKQYVEDYLKHYGRHRPIVVNFLFNSWKTANSDHQAIIASRILIEFGAAIEELFAFTYAITNQCNVPLDIPPEESEVFFKHLFNYQHRDIYSFAVETNFSGWIENSFNLPSSHEMAARMNYSEKYYRELMVDAETCLDQKKDDFFRRDFRSIHNKLKHPFLVLAPIARLDSGNQVLPVLLRSEKEEMVATVQHVEVGADQLTVFQRDILRIAQTIEFLLKLLLRRP